MDWSNPSRVKSIIRSAFFWAQVEEVKGRKEELFSISVRVHLSAQTIENVSYPHSIPVSFYKKNSNSKWTLWKKIWK